MKKLLLFAALLLWQSATWACSYYIGAVSEKYKNHLSIFHGKVVEIVFYDKQDFFGDTHIKVTFDITQQWKGRPEQNVLLTVYNGSSCYGYWFREGQNYIVYAFEDGETLNAWWCGGVISESDSPKEFKSEIRDLNSLTQRKGI